MKKLDWGIVFDCSYNAFQPTDIIVPFECFKHAYLPEIKYYIFMLTFNTNALI